MQPEQLLRDAKYTFSQQKHEILLSGVKTFGTKSVPGNSFRLHVLYFPTREKLTWKQSDGSHMAHAEQG